MKRKIDKQWQKKARILIQIGRLLEQGYPLHTAITFIELHVSNEMKKQLNEVLYSLREGHTVHESFLFFQLPPMFVSFLYFYERQGKLAEGFIYAGHLLEKREKLKHDWMKLLRYPFFLLWLCLLLLIFMYALVLPHFQSFFDLVKDVPPLTKAIYTVIELSPYLIALISIILCSVALYYVIKMRSTTTVEKVKRLLFIPYVGEYVRTIITYYFSLQLGRLLDAGLSLKEALSLFTNQTYVTFFQQECAKMMDELQEGIPFAQLLYERNYFKKDLSFVVEHGEKTGYIAKDLIHYSEMLYHELDERMLKVLRYVQPISLLFIGSIIFVLFLATLLPLFQMISTL